jgi:phosphoadenosine phosphosulfate reductase
MRIKEFETMALRNNPAGYYVCISGGKDSSVIQELCIMAGVKCEFVHNHTSVDHPETVYFVRREKERLEKAGHIFRINYPRYADGTQKTMWNGIARKGLPTRKVRWCCSELKEYGGIGRYCITGVRWAESAKRRNGRGVHEVSARKKENIVILNNDNDMRRRLSESCIPKQRFILNPIVDWSDEDVWDFIKQRNIPVNPLYERGYKRVGCVGCPMVSRKRKKELEEMPKFKNAYFRAVLKYFEYRKEHGLKWEKYIETPETYFNWWLGA